MAAVQSNSSTQTMGTTCCAALLKMFVSLQYELSWTRHRLHQVLGYRVSAATVATQTEAQVPSSNAEPSRSQIRAPRTASAATSPIAPYPAPKRKPAPCFAVAPFVARACTGTRIPVPGLSSGFKARKAVRWLKAVCISSRDRAAAEVYLLRKRKMSQGKEKTAKLRAVKKGAKKRRHASSGIKNSASKIKDIVTKDANVLYCSVIRSDTEADDKCEKNRRADNEVNEERLSRRETRNGGVSPPCNKRKDSPQAKARSRSSQVYCLPTSRQLDMLEASQKAGTSIAFCPHCGNSYTLMVHLQLPGEHQRLRCGACGNRFLSPDKPSKRTRTISQNSDSQYTSTQSSKHSLTPDQTSEPSITCSKTPDPKRTPAQSSKRSLTPDKPSEPSITHSKTPVSRRKSAQRSKRSLVPDKLSEPIRTCPKTLNSRHTLAQTDLSTNKPTVSLPKAFDFFCGKKFDYRHNHKLHKAPVHRKECPYPCKECGHQFSERSKLRRHLLCIHTTERPFSCTVCDEQFAIKEHLQRHMMKHTGEYPYGCTDCGKLFRQRQTLTRHQHIHTGVKPYGCPHCQCTFTMQTTLKSHLRTHNTEESYSCEVCGQWFSEKGSLSDHLCNRTEQKRFSCIVCSCRFWNKSELLDHVKIWHGLQSYPC